MPKPYRTRVTVLVAVAVFGAAITTLAMVRLLSSDVSAAPPAQRDVTNPCTALVTTTLSPDTIRLCEDAEVTIGVRPLCPGLRINIVFIIDEVYKIGYSNPVDRTGALTNAIERLGVTEQGNIQVGLVTMQRGRAFQRVDLTTDMRKVIGQLNIPMISRFDARPQCFDCGYREAAAMLDQYTKDHADTDVQEFVILAPMGVYTTQARPGIVRGAGIVKSRGATSVSGCYAWTHCVTELRKAASSGRLYLAYGEGHRMAGLLYDLVRQSTKTFLHKVVVTDLFPEAIEVITGSVAPAGVIDMDAGTLRWEFDEPIQSAYTLTYRVQPRAIGQHILGEGASVLLVDSHFLEASLPVPTRALSVPIDCAGTPTPLPTATPTLTPVPTATNAPTSTPTMVPPSPTPRPRALFLPLVLSESCVPARTFTDVALVLDMSTSMRSPSLLGISKLDGVLDAAQSLVDQMRLAPETAGATDRVAVVGFNNRAWIEQGLTSDPALLRVALDRLPNAVAEHTRLDLAFERGADALRGDRAVERSSVLIVLTDGVPNQVPYADDGTVQTTVLRHAAAAKAAGITVYTIGVGRADGARPDINEELLRAAASRPGAYYHAPDVSQLAEIYAQLVRVIPCGGARYWSHR